ncbi:MAG: ATP-binding protein [Flammeovirgaceae bacterium]|nr:MAG: ATP-binding protein [Flammeovirgaceae bacterium]
MDTVKRALVKRVALVGPECTGKTALSKALARHYQTVWVPEFARTYIEGLTRPYHQGDLFVIAQAQLQSEENLAKQANRVLICDTNLIVIKVWSEFKYGACDNRITQWLTNQYYHHHFLTDIDVPWEADPQREHPDKREYFLEVYRKELLKLNVPFTKLSGTLKERLHTATMIIDSLLSDKD